MGAWKNYWVQIKYPSVKIVKSYKIKADSAGEPEYPTAWSLWGSNDGNVWQTIEAKNGQSFSLGEEKTFEVKNDVAFTYYRLAFTDGRLYGGNGEIGRVQFFTVDENPLPIELDTGITLEQAKKLLSDTSMKIVQICKETGFSNVSYFCKNLREYCG